MSAAPLLQQNYLFTMQILSGSDKGKKFKLHPPHTTVGRENSNHIVLQDPKVSRHHLTLHFFPDDVTFEDHSQKKTVRINGKTPGSLSLRSGDIIHIGDTHLKFEVVSVAHELQAPAAQHLSAAQAAQNLSSSQQNYQAYPYQAPTPRAQKSFQLNGIHKILIVFSVLIAGVFLLSKDGDKKTKLNDEIRTDEMIQKSIEISQQLQQQLEEKRIKQAPGRAEAQKLYLKGFRDYQKGNYLRAMASFQAAVAADSHHELAIRYYSLAQRKNDELIDSSLQMSQKYKAKAMFERCVAYSEKVMTLLTNSKHPKFEEAMQIRKECQLLQESSQYQ